MRLCATADFHGFLPEIPECDVLLIAGDVCPVSDHRISRQREWLRGPFNEWLGSLSVREIVGIAGNHDFAFQEDPLLGKSLAWQYLHHDYVDISDFSAMFRFWGSPLSAEFFDWAFMASENELAEVYEEIPVDADVVITHGPAYGLRDMTIDGRAVGSPSLRERLVAIKPSLLVCGHIHEASGMDRLGKTLAVNASLVNFSYEPIFPPYLIELSKEKDAKPIPKTHI